jgi:sporulation protein YlmC with PRC-barrel domain
VIKEEHQMRNLLLASVAVLAIGAGPALADSLLSGAGVKVGGDAGANAGVAANVGGNSVSAGTSGVDVQTDTHVVVDAGAATNATSAATGAVDDALTTGASTAVDAAATAQANTQSSAQSVMAASQLIGKTVVDANGATVGEVSNAVLTTDAHAVSQIVVASGGFLGIGAREVAVDAASVDTSAASEGTVQLRNLTGADLDAMAEFQADGSVRLLNPS